MNWITKLSQEGLEALIDEKREVGYEMYLSKSAYSEAEYEEFQEQLLFEIEQLEKYLLDKFEVVH